MKYKLIAVTSLSSLVPGVTVAEKVIVVCTFGVYKRFSESMTSNVTVVAEEKETIFSKHSQPQKQINFKCLAKSLFINDNLDLTTFVELRL